MCVRKERKKKGGKQQGKLVIGVGVVVVVVVIFVHVRGSNRCIRRAVILQQYS